jgi:hypothetical protein
MGLFNKNSDKNLDHEKEFKNALSDWCGTLRPSKKYKEKLKTT